MDHPVSISVSIVWRSPDINGITLGTMNLGNSVKYLQGMTCQKALGTWLYRYMYSRSVFIRGLISAINDSIVLFKWKVILHIWHKRRISKGMQILIFNVIQNWKTTTLYTPIFTCYFKEMIINRFNNNKKLRQNLNWNVDIFLESRNDLNRKDKCARVINRIYSACNLKVQKRILLKLSLCVLSRSPGGIYNWMTRWYF